MRSRIAGRSVLYLFLVIIAILQLFPLLWVFDYSLLKSGDLFGPELLKLPLVPQWGNYVRAWVDGKIPRYFLNSTIVVASSVAVSALISFCLAYSITRMKWKLRPVAVATVTMGMVVPIHTTLLPNFLWFNYFGLIDTHMALIIPYVAFTLSFNTLVFMGQLRTLPRSMEESAFIDGASWPRIFWSVVAPMTGPAIVTVCLMTFLNNWNEFIMAYTYLATDELRTLPFSIIKFQGAYRSDYAIQFACMTLVAAVPLVLYFFFSKRILAGVTAGALKG
ncbi:MAG: carbohydrate ABC transporter permease [Candidatus Atribacteria bacterium]|nr:carbohydrate ABC transporter permease [Candidatus Atribacteria bacterium]